MMDQKQQQFRLLTCHCLNVQLHQHMSHGSTIQQIPPEQYPSEFVDLLEQQKSNGNDTKELDNFLLNCKLIKIVPDGININYEYLCLKRMADDYHQLQITFCAVCEKETHAMFVKTSRNVHFSNGDDDGDDSSPLLFVLVSNQLLNDEKKIYELKCDLNYSPALGIVMPKRLIYSDLNELKSDSGIGKTFNNNYDNSYFLISSYIQSDIQEKIKNFLQQEKILMQERIRRFTSEQEQIYKELCQITQDNRNSFLKMIEAIKIRHNIDNDSMDKENLNYQDTSSSSSKNNKTIVNSEKNVNKNFEIDVFHHHNHQNLEDVQNVSNEDFMINTSKTITPTMEKSPEELDCLFEMDDIDQSNHHHHVHFGLMDFSAGLSKGTMFQNDDDDDVGGGGDHDGQPNDDGTDTEEAENGQHDENVDVDEDVDLEERRDVFPLQESNSYSHVNNQRLSMDGAFSLNALPSSLINNDHHYQRQKKSSTSLVTQQQQQQQKPLLQLQQQQQPKNFYINSGNNANGKNHRKLQVASSLPIQIPHFPRRSSRELEESFRINPGESIADSIQKLARSVRNQNNILDDRPSRCLNTVDLIKSRPFFN